MSNFSDLKLLIQSTELEKEFEEWAQKISMMIRESSNSGKIITLFGNGGSAADAQHWAAELCCTYKSRNRRPFAALALTTDTSIMTAWSNDFAFETVFKRQLEAFKLINGLSIGLSTSGKSKNVLSGLNEAKSYGAKTILISGSSVETQDYDLHIRQPSTDTPIIQTLTQMLYHEICQCLEG